MTTDTPTLADLKAAKDAADRAFVDSDRARIDADRAFVDADRAVRAHPDYKEPSA